MHAQPEFISEPIVPDAGSADAAAMSRGEPGLPRSFTWRNTHYVVARVIAKWKTSSREAAGELYLRRHWFEIETTAGLRITLYCERQTRNRNKPKARWWIYTIRDGGAHRDDRGQ
jgi:phosphoribosylglycinamide formyltransferase-1